MSVRKNLVSFLFLFFGIIATLGLYYLRVWDIQISIHDEDVVNYSVTIQEVRGMLLVLVSCIIYI